MMRQNAVAPVAGVEHPVLCELCHYWDGRRGDRAMPARADIDPIALKAILPYLMLVDVEPSPLRFRYRLVGTFAYEAREGLAVRELTGRYADEVDYHFASPSAVHALGKWVIDNRQPLARITQYPPAGRQAGIHHIVLLPLSASGDAVDMLLCGAIIQRSAG
jgi:hypothetical protein